MKKSKFTKPIAGVISVITILTLIGTVGALNGWFGGGGKIPEDTFTRGLVAYWSFDEGSGNIAYDASGNGNHGTLTNGPKWTQGKIGGALSFDGVDDYVEVPHSSSLMPISSISISFWMKKLKDPLRGWVGLFYKRGSENSGYNGYSVLLQTDGSIRWEFPGVANAVVDSSVLANNTWYYIVAVYDGSSMKIFINGSLNNSRAVSGNIIPTVANLIIGTRDAYFNGLIDEVRIYNRALSPEEIRFHYSRGGPVAYWKFDEGQGTKVYDLSGNNNNGTLNLGTSGSNTDPAPKPGSPANSAPP